MDPEEAALRAKIQAVRNILAAKQAVGSAGRPSAAAPPFAAPYYALKPVHKTWKRADVAVPTRPATTAVGSANRVWVNQNAVRPALALSQTQPAHVSPAKRVRERQVLRLEDGEYAKANGGFSLVRSDVIKAKAEANAAGASAVTLYRKPTFSSSTTARAQAAVHRARQTTRGKAKARVRTEYCRFFNQFGYCNNKNACKFLHDSRRVALCRKFVRGICSDSQCLLSHDKNKMPVCTMFLRGACTRDDCRFRHVKVSGSAQVCGAFLSGHCPQGAACPLKHEATTTGTTSKKRTLSVITNTANASPGKQQKLEMSPHAARTSLSAGSNVEALPPSLSSSPTSVVTATPLSIRPNIRFAPRHEGGVFPLLLPLRKRQLEPPTNA